VRVQVQAAQENVQAVYLLRYGLGLTPPNRNPTLAEISRVAGAPNSTVPPEGLTPLADDSPLEVRVGEDITLRASFTSDSAETYLVPDGDPREGQLRSVTEILRVFWYATAGSMSEDVTGGDKPDTVLTLNERLPSLGAEGALVDLYVVGREERGGIATAHRTLRLRP
jgi:hypothetical protein